MTSRFHRIAAKPRCTSRREDRFRYQVWPVASALLSPTLTGAQNPRLSQMRLPIDGTIHPHRSSKEARRSRPPGAWPIKLPLRDGCSRNRRAASNLPPAVSQANFRIAAAGSSRSRRTPARTGGPSLDRGWRHRADSDQTPVRRRRGTDGSQTLPRRELDSNLRFRHGETPLGRAMWFSRTTPPAGRGTDPERDEKFESGFLQA